MTRGALKGVFVYKKKELEMAENNTEYLLRNINEKLGNRNEFSWQFWFGWLVAVPLGLACALLFYKGAYEVGGILAALTILVVIVNMVRGIIALYKSKQDTPRQ